jgi:CO dehydrogenase/acetyl-CoA synthase alpha subunit
MRVPPLYQKPSWQRFLAGAVVGGCISWIIFLFMFGALQEKQSKKIITQKSIIEDLQNDILIWQKEYKQINQKNAELLIVQSLQVKINNYKKYNIVDSQSIFEAEESIKKDLSSLLAKDLDTVYKNRELILKTLENKTITINNRRYKLVIKDIFFYSNIVVNLELKLA